jgi:hypothetical protein
VCILERFAAIKIARIAKQSQSSKKDRMPESDQLPLAHHRHCSGKPAAKPQRAISEPRFRRADFTELA